MNLLSKFGKFPALDENWKPSDFNITKILLWNGGSSRNRTFKPIQVEHMLHFELDLSQDLIAEIMEDYKQIKEIFISFGEKNDTTIRYVINYL